MKKFADNKFCQNPLTTEEINILTYSQGQILIKFPFVIHVNFHVLLVE